MKFFDFRTQLEDLNNLLFLINFLVAYRQPNSYSNYQLTKVIIYMNFTTKNLKV